MSTFSARKATQSWLRGEPLDDVVFTLAVVNKVIELRYHLGEARRVEERIWGPLPSKPFSAWMIETEAIIVQAYELGVNAISASASPTFTPPSFDTVWNPIRSLLNASFWIGIDADELPPDGLQPPPPSPPFTHFGRFHLKYFAYSTTKVCYIPDPNAPGGERRLTQTRTLVAEPYPPAPSDPKPMIQVVAPGPARPPRAPFAVLPPSNTAPWLPTAEQNSQLKSSPHHRHRSSARPPGARAREVTPASPPPHNLTVDEIHVENETKAAAAAAAHNHCVCVQTLEASISEAKVVINDLRVDNDRLKAEVATLKSEVRSVHTKGSKKLRVRDYTSSEDPDSRGDSKRRSQVSK